MATLNLSNLQISPVGGRNKAIRVGDTLRLTPGTDPGDAAGAAFSNQIAIKNDTSFTSTFQFQSSVANEPEGWTFILHNDPQGQGALGDVGPGLGYRDFDFARGAGPDTAFKISNALVIEFDTFGNGEFEDVGGNSIEVALVDASGNRILEDAAGSGQSLAFFQREFGGFDFNNGEAHTAWVDYDGSRQVLSIFLATGASPTKPTAPAISLGLSGVGNNLETIFGGTSAYVGFTAATGGPVQSHNILSFNFESTPAANVPPVLTGTPAELGYTEQGDPITVGIAGLAITDANGDDIAGATVTIADPQVEETLAVNSVLPTGVTASFTGGVLTITGTASPADYAALLQSITYQNSSDVPPASRTLTFVVADASSNSAPLTQTVAITAVDDPLTITGSLSLEVQTGTAAPLIPSQITVTDPDTLTTNIGYLVVGAPAHGQLELTTNPGVAITTFTQDDLATGRVQYVHNGSAGITDSIQFAVDDGPTEPNPATTLTLTIAISPEPIPNRLPTTGIPVEQTTTVDTPLVFSVANGNAITVTDPEDDEITLVVEAPTGTRLELARTTGLDITADPDGDESFTARGTAAALNAALNGLRFTPARGFTGSVPITLRADDDLEDDFPGTVSSVVVNVGSAIGPNPDSPALVKTAQNLFFLDGADTPQGAKFSLISHKNTGPVEFGFFEVDDADGSVGEEDPNSVGYITAALQGGQTIFSTLGDDDLPNLNLSRLLSLEPGGLYNFYMIQNGTADSLLKGGMGTIKFGSPLGTQGGSGPLLFNFSQDGSGYLFDWDLDGDQVFNDFQFKVDLTSNAGTALGASLQGGQESEVLDLTGLTGNVTLDLTVYREANYNNVLGFYRIEDAQGTILDEFGNALTPGDAGYIQAAVRQGANLPTLGAQQNRSVLSTTVSVAGGQVLAPFIIVNGTLDQLLDADPGNDPQIYFPFLGANSDGVDHVKLLGDNTFGFEDLAGGGDFDYDDLVVKVTVQPG